MDDTELPRPRTAQLLLPLILLAIGVLFSLLWQITALQAQRSAFKTSKAQLIETIKVREPQVAQAAEIKTRLEALANDLLEIAKTNPSADAIVKKYDIQRNFSAAKAASGTEK